MADEEKALTYGERMRKKLLGGGNGERDVWVEFEGEKWLLVPPKLGARNAVQDAAAKVEIDMETGKPKSVKTDQAEMMVQAVIACARDPQTRQQIFTIADRESFLEGEARPLFDVLATKAVELCRPANLEESKKNS